MMHRALLAVVLALIAATAARGQPVPVLFDTDIGTDIDDAYALALILRSPELELLGVTTVSGDAVARARLAAKLLAIEGGAAARVPVYAGTSTATQYMKQTEWAAGFTTPALHTDGGVAFMRAQIEARPGALTIIAVGELTNVAALLASSPGIAGKIKRIALMGGAVRPWRRARFDAAARVEHQVERRGSPRGVHVGRAADCGAARRHGRPEADAEYRVRIFAGAPR